MTQIMAASATCRHSNMTEARLKKEAESMLQYAAQQHPFLRRYKIYVEPSFDVRLVISSYVSDRSIIFYRAGVLHNNFTFEDLYKGMVHILGHLVEMDPSSAEAGKSWARTHFKKHMDRKFGLEVPAECDWAIGFRKYHCSGHDKIKN